VGPCRAFVDALRAEIPASLAGASLETALVRRTALDASHPALAERLAALGVSHEQARHLARVGQCAESAAQRLFGPALSTVGERLDARWRAAVAEEWRERHAAAQAQRAELATLEAEAATLSPDAACRRAELVEALGDADAALPLLRAVVSSSPQHASGALALGRILAGRDDPEAVALLERAVTLDPRLAPAAYALLQQHAVRGGDSAAARRYESLAGQAARRQERDADERSTLYERDSLTPAELTSEVVRGLRDAVAHDAAVQAAYVVRKELEVFPERPLHIVAVRGEGYDAARMHDLLAAQNAPGDVMACDLASLTSDFQARLVAIAGAPFYSGAR
jgi:hypothetical protein